MNRDSSRRSWLSRLLPVRQWRERSLGSCHWAWISLVVAPLLASLGCSTLGDGWLTRNALPTDRLQAAASSSGEAPHQADEPTQRSLASERQEDAPAEGSLSAERPAFTQRSDAEVVPVAYVEPPAAPQETTYLDAQHYGAACAAGCGGSCAVCSGPHPFRMNAQEYIFDGGDQQPTVEIREDWTSVGVEPTDTVVYYETEAGKVCVKPTNRVPIYAPRFGAVRQVRGAMLAARAVGTERILAPVLPGRIDETDLAGTVMQPVAPVGEEQVNLIDAFQESALGTPLEQIIPAQRMSEARVPFENINLLSTGRITDDEIAVLGQFLQNAQTWFKPELLEVIVDGQQASLMSKVKSPQDVLVYEPPGDKCALRICKAASHTVASPGDTIRFTIRFDNAGAYPIKNAVILDSLSPRLEYIEDSQQCSVDVRFSSEPNEVGSQILKWELVSPLGTTEGGAISFDCRVR